MNKLDLIKGLAPGFLPLIVFIAVDSIWGTTIGLIAAIVLGVIELAYSYIKDKVIDKFILLDVGLILVLGLISIVFNAPIFFLVKPAIIELIFCVILAVSVYSPVNVIMLMTKRYMKGVELNEAQINKMKGSLKILFYIFLGHTILIFYAAFYMSRGAWAFISGGLFYIIFAVYFVFELIKKKLSKNNWEEEYKDDEWFDIVDENGNVKGKAPRTICHSGPGMLHPVVHLHIVDNKNRIFLQKRVKTKKIQPGKWDTAVGGHVNSGESIEDALKRETEEELNIKDIKTTFIGKYVWESPVESELIHIYIGRYNKTITVNQDEIEEGKFWKIKKIKETIGNEILTPNFEQEFKIIADLIIQF